jgi:hypothetical protein
MPLPHLSRLSMKTFFLLEQCGQIWTIFQFWEKIIPILYRKGFLYLFIKFSLSFEKQIIIPGQKIQITLQYWAILEHFGRFFQSVLVTLISRMKETFFLRNVLSHAH